MSYKMVDYPTEYLHGHSNVVSYLQWLICQTIGNVVAEHWVEFVLDPVTNITDSITL